ncbi:MAG: hypothetical protein OXF84_06630 [Bacteroidetes bacterium]|nr:hypothetical protein [Bacteroidota bacterium]
MSRSRRKISRRVIRAVDKAGDASPYLVEWARAAGVSPRQLNLWRVLGRNEEEGLCRELSDLMDELDSLWIRVAEDEVRRLGFCPFEEVRVQGQAIDETSSAPLNVQLTLRPPPPQLGLRWLASKCPDVCGSRSLLDHKAESTEVVKVVFDDVVTGAG